MADANGAHVFPIRVYYEDTDAAGHVFYANYLKFAERGRTELLRAIGFDHEHVKRDHDVVFAVRRCNADFERPAKLDDALEVHTKLAEMGGASFRMEQIIKRAEEVLVTLDLTLVCMNSAGRATRIPAEVRDKMAAAPAEST